MSTFLRNIVFSCCLSAALCNILNAWNGNAGKYVEFGSAISRGICSVLEASHANDTSIKAHTIRLLASCIRGTNDALSFANHYPNDFFDRPDRHFVWDIVSTTITLKSLLDKVSGNNSMTGHDVTYNEHDALMPSDFDTTIADEESEKHESIDTEDDNFQNIQKLRSYLLPFAETLAAGYLAITPDAAATDVRVTRYAVRTILGFSRLITQILDAPQRSAEKKIWAAALLTYIICVLVTVLDKNGGTVEKKPLPGTILACEMKHLYNNRSRMSIDQRGDGLHLCTRNLASGAEMDQVNPICSICLAPLHRGDVVSLTPCGHVFHPQQKDCEGLDTWKKKNENTCPICREPCLFTGVVNVAIP